MQKSTEESPNPSVTRSDIFGDDDTSDEDEVENSGERESDRKKRKMKRVWLS